MDEGFDKFSKVWLGEGDNVTSVCNFWANNLVDCLFIWMIVVGERSGVLLWVSYFDVVFCACHLR